MKRALLILLIPIAVLLAWAILRRTAPPEVPFARAVRGDIQSTLVTNGLVEPIEWAAVRAEQPGLVESVQVERGAQVSKGQPIVTMDAREARAALAAAEARIAQAQSEIARVERGGSPAELQEIESAIRNATLEQQAAQRELSSLERLAAKQAATRAEVDAARDRLNRANAEIRSLRQKRNSLVSPSERSVAQANLRDAQAAAALAREQIGRSVIRAPIAGTLYNLEARAGSYLNPGDLVGTVGKLGQLRVIVYVDEPELGRVEKGMPVKIGWDAMPERKWDGAIDRIPTQVVTLGTRQVGEVVAIIDNPGATLIPGTNINAEILTQVATNTLVVPKETVRRTPEAVGVYSLEGDVLRWKPVRAGISSVTRTQILQGLTEGDAVALPTDRPLNDGMQVTPVFPQQPAASTGAR